MVEFDQLTEEDLACLEFPLDLLEQLPIQVSQRRAQIEPLEYETLFKDDEEGYAEKPAYVRMMLKKQRPLQFTSRPFVMGYEQYIGQLHNGMRDGIGILIDLSPGEEYMYEGQFRDGYKHGFGRQIIMDFRKGIRVQEGEYVDDKACGAMIMVFGFPTAVEEQSLIVNQGYRGTFDAQEVSAAKCHFWNDLIAMQIGRSGGRPQFKSAKFKFENRGGVQIKGFGVHKHEEVDLAHFASLGSSRGGKLPLQFFVKESIYLRKEGLEFGVDGTHQIRTQLIDVQHQLDDDGQPVDDQADVL